MAATTTQAASLDAEVEARVAAARRGDAGAQ